MSASGPARTGAIGAYAAPRSVEEAVRALAGAPSTVVAGGTDLLVQPAGAWTRRRQLVNIQRIDALRGIAGGPDEVRIGALTTLTEIRESAWLRERVPVLPATADAFASDQIRNMATVGGNLCNASPAGDLPIPLLVLDAAVVLASWSGSAVETRSVPLAEFFEGPGEARIRDDELLTEVRFPAPPEGFVARFVKTGPRPALEVALVSVALGGVRAEGRLRRVRAAFGAVAPVPMRGAATEAALEDRPLDDGVIRAAAAAAAGEVSPISDVRASGWYRSHLIRTFTERVLRDVARG